jgi:hypothetical protein
MGIWRLTEFVGFVVRLERGLMGDWVEEMLPSRVGGGRKSQRRLFVEQGEKEDGLVALWKTNEFGVKEWGKN